MSSNKWVQNEVFFQGFFPNRLLQVSRVVIFAIMRVPLMFVWDHWDVGFLNSDQFRESNWQVSFLFDRSWLFNMKKGSHRWQLYIWHILLYILYDTYDISYIYVYLEGRSTAWERGKTWVENKERERGRDFFLCWFVPQMEPMMRDGTGQNQEPRAESTSPTWLQASKSLSHLLLLSQGV